MNYTKLLQKISLAFILILAFLNTTVLAQEIDIVQFTDIHLDTTRASNKVRMFGNSLNMFQKAIIKVNAINPDIIVFSGDMVNRPVESEFDIFLKNAKQLNTNFYPIFGNHDVGVQGGLSKSTIINKLNKNCDWLDIENNYYSVNKGEYTFIFLDGTSDTKITSNGYFKPEVLAFLDKTLNENMYQKAIIVQHFPMIEPVKSASHEVINKQEYFNIIDKHKNVVAVLTGHYHAAKMAVRNNVLYVTTPSLIEYPHAFRYLNIDDNSDEIVINSKLIFDEEQNERENTLTPYAKLKMGQPTDSQFTVTLKNNVPKKPAVCWLDKIKSFFREIKLLCQNFFSATKLNFESKIIA